MGMQKIWQMYSRNSSSFMNAARLLFIAYLFIILYTTFVSSVVMGLELDTWVSFANPFDNGPGRMNYTVQGFRLFISFSVILLFSSFTVILEHGNDMKKSGFINGLFEAMRHFPNLLVLSLLFLVVAGVLGRIVPSAGNAQYVAFLALGFLFFSMVPPVAMGENIFLEMGNMAALLKERFPFIVKNFVIGIALFLVLSQGSIVIGNAVAHIFDDFVEYYYESIAESDMRDEQKAYFTNMARLIPLVLSRMIQFFLIFGFVIPIFAGFAAEPYLHVFGLREELDELRKERDRLKSMMKVAEKKFYKREIDEQSFREIIRDDEKRMIELETRIKEIGECLGSKKKPS